MGIPHLYKNWIRADHPNSLVNRIGFNNEGICFDMNGLLHKIAEETYAYGKTYGTVENIKKMAAMTEAELDAEYFTNLKNKIISILRTIQPKQYVIFCVDGVAPKAKINQQRMRRYMSKLVEYTGIKPKFIFNSNCITPGTKFMEIINVKLENWFSSNRELFPDYLIYSSHRQPGEGEHKMFNHLREQLLKGQISQGTGYHIVYGLDADLVMLASLSPMKNILLCRENLTDNVSIDILNAEISQKIQQPVDISSRDFVLMLFLIGNDFLPHIPSINEIHYSINLMFSIYRELKASLTLKDGDKYRIYWSAMFNFITKLASKEPELLGRRGTKDYKYPFTMLIKHIDRSKVQKRIEHLHDHYNVKGINFNSFRTDWYTNALPGSANLLRDLEIMAASYIASVEWVMGYYLGYDVSQYFAYNFTFAPLLADIAIIIREYIRKGGAAHDIYRKSTEEEIVPVYQLLSVLPTRSHAFIPSPFDQLILPNSYLYDLCPLVFNIFREGNDEDFEGVPILPPSDLNRVIYTVKRMMIINTSIVYPDWHSKQEDLIHYRGPRLFKPKIQSERPTRPDERPTRYAERPTRPAERPTQLKRLPAFQRKDKPVAKVLWTDRLLM